MVEAQEKLLRSPSREGDGVDWAAIQSHNLNQILSPTVFECCREKNSRAFSVNLVLRPTATLRVLAHFRSYG